MNILIVGNGFDLAHGLPTSYSDFLGFVIYFKIIHDANPESIDRCKEADEFKKLDTRVQEYLLSEKIRNKQDKLMNELYSLLSNNTWINHLEECSLKNRLKGKNWIDFESEISEVVRALEYLKKNNKEILKYNDYNKVEIDDNELYKKACDFLYEMKNLFITRGFDINEIDPHNFYDFIARKIINELNNDLNSLIRCLEIYLEDVVGNIKIIKTLPDINEIDKIDKLISFNYTNTFKKVYDEEQKVEYDYIHGKLDISRDIIENNMVLGIDEYLEDGDKNKELDFIQFKKYFQRIYKKTGCKYKNWLEKLKNSKVSVLKPSNSFFENNIYIYGHSLDVTDKDILKELIMFPKTQTTIFYYDKNDYAQKIANLVGIIEQDILIDSVYGKNPRIIFKEIQK